MASKIFLRAFLSVLLLLPAWAMAQDATISGKVTDTAGNPLPGANVVVELTNLGAATDVDGKYSFTVPAKAVKGQEVRVTARFIGYRSKTEKVTLSAGAMTKDFSLPTDVLDLDAIVVTGVVEETPKTKLAISVAKVSSEALQQVPSSSPETALYGKVAGVKVVRGVGQPGTSASIQLRAPTSINTSGRSADPLYIVDGVVIDPSITGSPLTDIPSDEIESMEVVKGAASASTYGSRAANGVIRISTNRGNRLGLNETKIRVRNEVGASQLARKIELNQHHYFKIATTSYTDSKGKQVAPGDFIDAAGNWVDPRVPGARVPDAFATGIFFADKPYKYVATGKTADAAGNFISPQLLPGGQPFDHIDRFFNPGDFIANTFSISRNMEKTNFLVSFGNRTEGGVVEGLDGLNRKNLQINLDHRIRNDLQLSVSGLYSTTRRDLTNNNYGPFFGLTFMSGDADLAARDENGDLFVRPDYNSPEENPLYIIENNEREDKRNRVMGSFNLRYSPIDWFNVEGSLSYDRSDRNNELFWPIGYNPVVKGRAFTGQYAKGNFNDQALNGNVVASLTRQFGGLVLRLKAQGLFERTEYSSTNVDVAALLTQGIRNLEASGADTRQTYSEFRQIRSNGYSFIAGFDYNDKYIGDVHVRRDGSSLFGPDDRWHWYYRGSVAYRISQEPWWFMPSIFDEFKLRGSYGTAGGRPSFYSRFETWSISGGRVTKSVLGNKLLRPEFAKELELGWDAAFLKRFNLEFTYAKSDVDDQLLYVPLPGYVGYSYQWRNAGKLKTNTFEVGLNASILRTRNFQWSAGINFDRSRQKIAKLENVPPYVVYDTFYITEGEELGAIYGDRWLKSLDELPAGIPHDQFNVNDDGYVVWVGAGNTYKDGIAKKLWGTSATIRDQYGVNQAYRWGIPIKFLQTKFKADGSFASYDAFVKLGSTVPDFNMGFHNDFRWKNLTVFTVLDAQIGGDVYNQTLQWGLRENKTGEADQSGKSEELKKPELYYTVLYNVDFTNSHFVEDGTYLKLRELAVNYTFNRSSLPGFLSSTLSKLTVGVIGRNLLTFTGYRGYDPESNVSAGLSAAGVARYDDFGYPQFRTITGIVEFEF
jgi:TonB-linked SusC/RagA family outer membrane protein